MEKQNKRQIVDNEIDMIDLSLYLLRKWFLILLCFIIGASAYGAYTWAKADTYTSTASLFIQTETTSITSLADIQLGNALSSDFVELAGCKAVLDTAIDEVKEETGIQLSRADLKSWVSITNTDNTRLLVFSATTDNAELSCSIAESMADATAQQVSVIMNTEEPKFVDHAEAEKANSKNLTKKIAIGGLAGAAAVCAILVFLYLMDDMVVTEEDLKKYFGVNVLGLVSVDRSRTFKMKKKKK